MRAVRLVPIAGLLLVQLACDDEPLRSKAPAEPPPPAQGLQAFLQVDNDRAKPGDVVRVYVKVQIGTETPAKLGSYTGRLKFDPGALAFQTETPVNDGLRVSNPNHADDGEIRFAGAAATGFANLTLYEGAFAVKKADYMEKLQLEVEELSAAMSLTNLRPQLQVTPQIFLRSSAQ